MVMALNQFAALITDGQVTTAAELDWSLITHEHTHRARTEWAARYTREGARVRLNAVKGALRAAWRLELISTDRMMRAIDLAPIRGETLQRGRALTDAELDALFADCATDQNAYGTRDAAIIAAFRSGARVGEIRTLALADYYPPDRSGVARLRISGKGDRERWGYLDPAFAAFIDRWLEFRGREAGPLFNPLTTNAKQAVTSKGLSERAVQDLCARRATRAGIPAFTPHDFRRTTATELDDAGEPITVIRDVLGHTSVQTTERYLRNDREMLKQRAAARLRRPRSDGDRP